MESDPYLALAEDSRRFGNIHKPVTQTEVLAEAVSQFKQAIGEAQKQVILNQKLSLSLSNELEIKDRLLEEEKKTTDRLIEEKKNLLLLLAESREKCLALEARLNAQNQTQSNDMQQQPPPLPPKSTQKINNLSASLNNLDINDTNEVAPELPKKKKSLKKALK